MRTEQRDDERDVHVRQRLHRTQLWAVCITQYCRQLKVRSESLRNEPMLKWRCMCGHLGQRGLFVCQWLQWIDVLVVSHRFHRGRRKLCCEPVQHQSMPERRAVYGHDRSRHVCVRQRLQREHVRHVRFAQHCREWKMRAEPLQPQPVLEQRQLHVEHRCGGVHVR